MFIIYKNSAEILVCNIEDEKAMLKSAFTKQSGRDVEDYIRVEKKDPYFVIQSGYVTPMTVY